MCPLKIAEPSIRLTLLDSLGKRMRWLETVLPALGVDAEVVTGRAEEYVAGCREQYDAAVSRAVARLNVLAELCLPYVKVGGQFLAMKGAMAQEEADEAASAIRRLGGQIERIAEYPHRRALYTASSRPQKLHPRRSPIPAPLPKSKKHHFDPGRAAPERSGLFCCVHFSLHFLWKSGAFFEKYTQFVQIVHNSCFCAKNLYRVFT